MAQSDKMLPGERRAALSLALVYVFRMMGLFMVLPVLSLYADDLIGSTPFLLGMVLGVYGLTQAVLQIPFGLLSDRFGRKPVILAGLMLFLAGSVVAALSTSIWGVIAGRALQGAGAIAAAVMALAADLSRDSQRTKVMAIIGASIGGAFLLSLMIGPLLSSWIGVSGLFWATAVLAIVSIAMVLWVVPTPVRRNQEGGFRSVLLGTVIKNKDLLRLDLSIFSLHGILSAVFVVVPFLLRDRMGLPADQHWYVYLPVMLASLLLAAPVIMRVGRDNAAPGVIKWLILGLMAGVALVWGVGAQWWGMALGLVVFFIAFNVLESCLPALISRMAPPDYKGTAMGVYSTSQFAGTFVGSVLAGWALNYFDHAQVLLGALIFALVWFLLMGRLTLEQGVQSCALEVGPREEGAAQALVDQLSGTKGVMDVSFAAADGIVYVRYRETEVDESQIMEAIREI